jgi:hypothetical protein
VELYCLEFLGAVFKTELVEEIECVDVETDIWGHLFVFDFDVFGGAVCEWIYETLEYDNEVLDVGSVWLIVKEVGELLNEFWGCDF